MSPLAAGVVVAAVMAGVHDGRTPQTVSQTFPGATVGREFIGGELSPMDLRPKFDKLSAPWLTLGGQVYVSFKPKAADVSAGKWDAHFQRLGAWLADHPRVKVIVYHEPEDNMAGTTFATMFNRTRDKIKVGWAGATVAYCAMAYQWRKGGKAAASPSGWQKVVADEYLVDVYSGVSFPETAILPEHPGFTGWFDAIVRPRLSGGEAVAWGMGERGFQAKSSATRAATIRREAEWLAGLPAEHAAGAPTKRPPMLYLAWNTGGTENDADWMLDSAGEEAMRYLISQVLTARGVPTQTPDNPEPGPVVLDRFDLGYAAGVDAGRASREEEIVQARAEGSRAGYAAAYSEMIQWATAQAAGSA